MYKNLCSIQNEDTLSYCYTDFKRRKEKKSSSKRKHKFFKEYFGSNDIVKNI